MHRLRRVLALAFVSAAGLTLAGWLCKGRLVDPGRIHPELLREPSQVETSRATFSFRYKGRAFRVRPVAAYELRGLVVSHNNIKSLADMYHDSTSVDTKDLCVVWGSNLESDTYRRVSYRSGSFTCYFSYPPGVRFRHDGLSNNHLITDDPRVREAIDRVRVGDQIRLAGLLVDYQLEDWRDFWRKTSTVRDDSGCEVVFVEELEVLRRATPVAYAAYRLGWWLMASIPPLYLGALHLEARGASGTRLGRL